MMMQTLYKYGARSFLVWNVEPQGCLPYTLTLIPHTPADLDVNGCLSAYNGAAQFFNGLLKTALANLQTTLVGANVIMIDMYQIKADLLRNLTQNGNFLTLPFLFFMVHRGNGYGLYRFLSGVHRCPFTASHKM